MRDKSVVTALLKKIPVAILFVLAGLGFYHYNAQAVVGNPLPMPFGYGAAVVMSGSMEPAFSVGDLVFVKDTDQYEVGDVVIYQEQAVLVMHRIHAVEEETIITQGDANDTADLPVYKTQVRGLVIASVPAVGDIFLWMKRPAGIIMTLLTAFLLLEIPYWRERQRDQEELEAIKAEIRKLKEEKEDHS